MNLRRFDSRFQENEIKKTKENNIKNGILDSKIEDNEMTVFLSGKIDATNFEEIQEKAFELLEKENTKAFVFDMNDVSYVSSAGLRMFSAVNRKATEIGISYKLSKMREDIMKLFQMTGYASAFCIELKEE